MTREPNITRTLPTPDETLARMRDAHHDNVANFWMREGPIVAAITVIAMLIAGLLTDTMQEPRLWVLSIPPVGLLPGLMLYPRRPTKMDADVVRQVSALVRGVRRREQPAEVVRLNTDSPVDNLTRK